MPPEVRKLVEARRDAIKAGELHPFTGPLHENTGKEFVAAGHTLDDEALRKIHVYVRGVEGSVPQQAPHID